MDKMNYVILKKMKHEYDSMNKVAKASLWYTFSNFMQKFIVVMSVPIITRMITSAEYGMYSVYSAWFEIIYNICTLALASGGYYVGMKKYLSRKYMYDSSILSLCFCITFLLFAVFGFIPTIWTSIIQLPLSYIFPMLVGVLSGCPRDFWAVSERYELKYVKLVLVTLITSVGVLICQAGVLKLHIFSIDDNTLCVIWGGLIPSIIVGIPIFILILMKGKLLFNKEIWVETLKFNSVLIPYYMSITFLNQIDRVMIERFIGASYAGYYSVAYRAASTINILTIALNQSFMPWIFQKLKNQENRELNRISTFILIIPFLIALLMVLLAPEIIMVLSGKEYIVAAGIIPSVSIGMCLRFVSQIFINVEMFYEKNKLITIITMVVAVINVVLNGLFIPRFGFLSAGYTTLICFLIQALLHCWIVRRLTEERFIFNYRKIWFFIILFSLFGLVLSCFYSFAIARYFIILFAFAICIWQRKRIMKYISIIVKNKA